MLAPGTRLGGYEIVGPLGAGGMGEVYRARDPRLKREVAIKVLPPEVADDAERLRRFEREARATAALSHPNILVVFELGTEDGVPFLVSELLSGETLRERLGREPLPAARAIDFAIQLARGMAAAHARGIVHRDLKPENLFLTVDGQLKILDFGLAQTAPSSPARAAGTAETEALTQAGSVLGSAGYMAPEQVRGQTADHRADIFAFGAILYEMLVHRRAFQGGSMIETLAAVLRESPSGLDEATGKLAVGVSRLIARCLEKEPARRFQSAQDLAFGLESLSEAKMRVGSDLAPSIAVLPFADMSETRDQQYFCEGLAEELINALAHVDGLHVASRTASFQFPDASSVATVGARLHVQSLLEGSVRKAGDRLRVTVQLVNVADGYRLWSERFDRQLEDVFAVQDEIAANVAHALRVVLEPPRRPPTQDVEAYDYYLRGRRCFYESRRPSLETAKQMFSRAIELDPGYARAWAGLADCHSWLYMWFGGSRADLLGADRASARALELGPELAEAHAARGLAFSLDRRHDDAEREFLEAERRDPRLFEAHYFHARACLTEGKLVEAAARFETASQVRPEDFQAPSLLALAYGGLGRLVEQREANRRCVAAVERHLELYPEDPRALYLGGNSLVQLGEVERGLAWGRRALAVDPGESSIIYNVACLNAVAGQTDEALALLARSVNLGISKEWLDHDPDWNGLREHAAFRAAHAKLVADLERRDREATRAAEP